MIIKGFRIQIIVIAAVLAFILIIGGQNLYRRYMVLEPLVRGLQAIEGVEGVALPEGQGGRSLVISLAPVTNLAATLKQVEGLIYASPAGKTYGVTIRDRRNPELEKIYHRLHFVLYEAVARGNFTTMAVALEEEATRSGLDYHLVTVDRERIYVQLHQGEAYLYETVSRETQAGKGEDEA